MPNDLIPEHSWDYDVIVIGSGPAGEKAAAKAAYFGCRVAVIEQEPALGGAGVNTGTIPSKTLKESALFFSGRYDRGLYGVERELSEKTTVSDFMFRRNQVAKIMQDKISTNLANHGIRVIRGSARFLDDHRGAIHCSDGSVIDISAAFWIIATGSYPYHPPGVPFGGKGVYDSDSILEIDELPKTIAIIGAGVIGCEYATIFAAMGTKVHLINDRKDVLGFLDEDVTSELVAQMKAAGITFHLERKPKTILCTRSEDETHLVTLTFDEEEPLVVEALLFSSGRSGRTKDLDLSKAGVSLGPREALVVNDHYQTNIPHIYGVGDVIGFPALASTGMDQGRVAVSHILGTKDLDSIPKVIPYGIYTIPEVSMIGITEAQAKTNGLSYCTGLARYPGIARGLIIGVDHGFLKLVFDRANLEVLGVHIIGPLASELIHYGLSLIENKRNISQIIATVFNYPTLHDLYKYAAYDGLGNLAGHKLKKD